VKTILVTGGAGFVGSHACKALARAGYFPVTFDSLERGHEWAVKWGPLERGDLCNEDDLALAFTAHRPWAAMHCRASRQATSIRITRCCAHRHGYLAYVNLSHERVLQLEAEENDWTLWTYAECAFAPFILQAKGRIAPRPAPAIDPARRYRCSNTHVIKAAHTATIARSTS
jgi:hypothetical protein